MHLGYVSTRRTFQRLSCDRALRLSPQRHGAVESRSAVSLRTASTDTAAPAPENENALLPSPLPESPSPQHEKSEDSQPPRPSSSLSGFSLTDRLRRVPIHRHGAQDSVLVKLPAAVRHPRERHEEARRLHRYALQQQRIEAYRRQPNPGDWRVILHHLLTWTPTHVRVGDKVKVVLSREAASLLRGDGEGNIRNVKSRTGCTIHAYWPDDDSPSSADAYVVLSGQPTAIAGALDEILKVTKKVTIFSLRDDSETRLHDGNEVGTSSAPALVGAPAETTESVTQYSVPLRPYVLTMRADEIPRPKEWTHAAFEQYVAALTMGRIPRSLAQKIYDGPKKHKEIVVEQLLAVFKDPAAQPVISLPAFKMALKYLVRSGESLVGPARELFDTVFQTGLRMDTDAFNLLAETSVRSKNLLAFQSNVRLMLNREHPPNLQTWLLFLRIIEAEDVRRYIIEAMNIKGFFNDPAAVVAVADGMASLDTLRAVQLGQTAQQLLDSLREVYGPAWRLTSNAANKMLHVFAQHSQFDQAKVILEKLLEDYSLGKSGPDTLSLNTLLNHCRLQRKLDLAIEFVKMFDERGLRVYDKATFHSVFLAAYHQKKPHLLSAVWRYAHLVDLPDWRMRKPDLLLCDGPKRQKLLSRLRSAGLWDEQHDWSAYTEQYFVENLFFCDYRPHCGFGSPHEGTPLNPSKDRHELYDQYIEWASAVSRTRAPALPLGQFLETALARDRKLLEFARSKARPAQSPPMLPLAAKPIPRFMLPLKLPLVPRPPPTANQLFRRFPALSDSILGTRAAGRPELEYNESGEAVVLQAAGERANQLREEETQDGNARATKGL